MLNMYINTSDNRYLNKSLTTLASDIPCEFKADTSATNPTIIISPDAYNASCNYVYLSDTDRYYFVSDKIFSQQKVELVLSIDVRSSFDFSNCNCIALRSSNKYNSYLNDAKYSQLAYNRPVIHKFDNSFSKNNQFILSIAGGV